MEIRKLKWYLNVDREGRFMSSLLPPKKSPLALIGGAISGALAAIVLTHNTPFGAIKIIKIVGGLVTGAFLSDRISRKADPRKY